MEKIRGTEYTIDINNNINIVFGSVDKNNPRAVFIKLSGWANTINFDDYVEYGSVIKKITKKIKRDLYFNIDQDLFKKDMSMVDMDMRESGIGSNKPSFMSCEITLYQVKDYLLDDYTLVDEMTRLIKNICEEILNKDIYFKFHKDKKQAKKKLEEA
jgi:hypothetical protein|tara:strand:- start:3786 stop:4256 length:471 start_codon:yes stop_codon:yes gene_type:complete